MTKPSINLVMKENRFLMDFNEVVKFINFLVENEIGFETDTNKVVYRKEYHKISIEFDIELNNGDYLWAEYYDDSWEVEVYNNGNMEEVFECYSVEEVIEFVGDYIERV